MSMVDRAFLLSHPRFHKKNLNFKIEMFLSNNYPLQFIFDTIRKRLKILFNKRTKKQNLDNINNDEKKGWFLIPFIPNVTDEFKRITKKSKLTYVSLHKLGRIVPPPTVGPPWRGGGAPPMPLGPPSGPQVLSRTPETMARGLGG